MIESVLFVIFIDFASARVFLCSVLSCPVFVTVGLLVQCDGRRQARKVFKVTRWQVFVKCGEN